MSLDTFEDVLRFAKKRKFLINQLYQCDDDTWSCNMRRITSKSKDKRTVSYTCHYYEMARKHSSAFQALKKAYLIAKREQAEIDRKRKKKK